jgi:hypothetical protein
MTRRTNVRIDALLEFQIRTNLSELNAFLRELQGLNQKGGSPTSAELSSHMAKYGEFALNIDNRQREWPRELRPNARGLLSAIMVELEKLKRRLKPKEPKRLIATVEGKIRQKKLDIEEIIAGDPTIYIDQVLMVLRIVLEIVRKRK